MNQNVLLIAALFVALITAGCPQAPPPPKLQPPPETVETPPKLNDQSEHSDSSVESTTTVPQEQKKSADQVPIASVPEPASKTSSASNPEEPSGTSANGREPDGSNANVLAEARSLYERSKLKSAAGNHAEAFLAARDAWVRVKDLNGLAAESLSKEIFSKLSSLADRASQENDASPSETSRPLLLK